MRCENMQCRRLKEGRRCVEGLARGHVSRSMTYDAIICYDESNNAYEDMLRQLTTMYDDARNVI
jgi:hypothetical protein